MGNYDILTFKQSVQDFIKDNKIDKDSSGYIESDNGELATLLSNLNEDNIENLLESSKGFSYAINTESNIFLKQYLEEKAKALGVGIPAGLDINISSPKEYSEDFKNLLKYVRTEIYGARVLDMFNLLVQDEDKVRSRVAQMQIGDGDKNKILELKSKFDSYYKIEANYKGKSYDLSNPNVEELKNISPEFSDFIKKENSTLKKHMMTFARGEIESVELAEAAEDSKKAVPILLSVLGVLAGKELIQSWQESKAMKTNKAALIAETKSLARQKAFKVVNPFKEITRAMKGKKGWLALAAISPILLNTLAGSIDDLSGAGKDLFQDKDCFGWGKASAIAAASVVGGVGTSFAIAGMYERTRGVLKARRSKFKFMQEAAMDAGKLDRFNSLRRTLRPNVGTRILRGGKFALIAGLFGMVTASCTSGSSWTSMAGTRLLFGLNGNKLEDKNIITAEENTFTGANENMMKYEAYEGKWRGIAVGPTSDPVVGFTLGATGLLTHPLSMVANAAFTTQGCSETLTACGYQLLGNTVRENKLDKEKQSLVEDAKQQTKSSEANKMTQKEVAEEKNEVYSILANNIDSKNSDDKTKKQKAKEVLAA